MKRKATSERRERADTGEADTAVLWTGAVIPLWPYPAGTRQESGWGKGLAQGRELPQSRSWTPPGHKHSQH